MNLSQQGKKYINKTAVRDVLNGTKIKGSQEGPPYFKVNLPYTFLIISYLPTTWLTIQAQAEVCEKAGTSVACAFSLRPI
jgi:hypothetical protein